MDWSFIDCISILSFIVGLQNLELNQKQIDNLETHLSKQDNELLSKIIKQNDELINLDKVSFCLTFILMRDIL